MHAVFVMANDSYCQYFVRFAAKAKTVDNVKISFIFLNDTKPEMTEVIEGYGCKTYWLKFDRNKKIGSMIKSVLPLVKLLRKINPDIVHTHLFDDSLPTLVAARIAGIKKRYITKQDTFFHWNFVRNKVIYDRINNFNATNIVAVSEETREFIIDKEKANRKKVELIHHGIIPALNSSITEEDKAGIRARFGLEGKLVITTVARYIDWKGYRLIIEAAKKIVGEFPNSKFLFVGFGDQKVELEDLVRKNDLWEYITITDFLKPSEVALIYNVSDMYLHASLNEPFGFVIAEAMMYGLPVVSTNTGAARDAIRHKENGMLVFERTSEEIAKVVIEILKMPNYKELGSRGKETAQEMYHFDVMWNNHIKSYKLALEQTKNS